MQTLNRTVVNQVFFNDLVNVVLIDIPVPDAFRVDHQNRTLVATVQTARAIDTDRSTAVFFQGFNFFFCVRLDLSRPAAATADGTFVTFVDTEKYVFLKIRHDEILTWPDRASVKPEPALHGPKTLSGQCEGQPDQCSKRPAACGEVGEFLKV